jgi:hypothetical protein
VCHCLTIIISNSPSSNIYILESGATFHDQVNRPPVGLLPTFGRFTKKIQVSRLTRPKYEKSISYGAVTGHRWVRVRIELNATVVPLCMWMRRAERSHSIPCHSTPLRTASRGRWLGGAWLGVKPKPPIAPRSTPRRTKIKNKGKSKRGGNREIRSEISGREHDFRVSRVRLSSTAYTRVCSPESRYETRA